MKAADPDRIAAFLMRKRVDIIYDSIVITFPSTLNINYFSLFLPSKNQDDHVASSYLSLSGSHERQWR